MRVISNASATAIVCLVCACSNSPSAEHSTGSDAAALPDGTAVVALDGAVEGSTADAGPLPPGDHFFDCAATVTGIGSDDGASVGADGGGDASVSSPFRVAVMTYDPKYAANHAAGTPGSNSNIQEASGKVVTPDGQTISLDGTWSDNGSVSLQGSGWTLEGTIAGVVFTGSFTGSGGPGVLAGADITVGQVGVSFGSQEDGTPFDVVVSEAGPVTGCIGGASGGFISGSASGNTFTYSWQTNETSGSGSGTVAASGNLSGMPLSSSCTPVYFGCWQDDVTGEGASCDCGSGATPPAAPGVACAGMSCCLSLSNQNGCSCESQALLLDRYAGGSDASADQSEIADLCATWRDEVNSDSVANGLVWTNASECLDPSSADGGTSGSSCTQSWQATPAPCTAISYSGGALGTVHTGVAVQCPGPFANLSGTCAGGNTAACTPPPGGCACPAAGGCSTCGTINACCLP